MLNIDSTYDRALPDGLDVSGLRSVQLLAGSDPIGLNLEVLVAEWTAADSPPLGAMRQLHKSRKGDKIFPLVVVAIHPTRKDCWLFGPNTDSVVVGPLPGDVAARMLEAALGEPSGLAAQRRLSHLQRALETTPIPGVSNSGLFASHYVSSDTGVRAIDAWSSARATAEPLLVQRGNALISALGFTSSKTGAHARILSAGGKKPRAIAVLLDEGETFNSSSDRFSVSPVAYGLSLAQKEEVPWLIVLRGSQIRLYPSSPDVGVGRRGLSETFFELDLALLSSNDAGFLGLVFTADALAADGSVEHLLHESERFASALGVRLRQRVYEQVIPVLSVAVAEELERKVPAKADDLDLAYRLTLRILFRLLFQAYAEDRGLLPYGRNSRYDRNALKTWALDLATDTEIEFDPESQSIWDDLAQVWRVIDNGDTAWDVPAYDGGLFGSDPDLYPEGAILDQLVVMNDVMGYTLLHLLVDETVDEGVGPVDFRSLSVREFGTIYEGLLESSLSRADVDLTIDKAATYVPAKKSDQAVVVAGEIYFHNASGERKATGSYFTPSFAVEHLLERALDPTLSEHLNRVGDLLSRGDEAGATEAFFDFRIGDLAMGSGHFLVAAVDHMESAMAAFLADHHLPSIVDELRRLEGSARDALGNAESDYEIEPSALLRRQIARRCIYGIDSNPIAVELARVAMWIHTFVPGLPMSSLDHTLVCANSLTGIGTIEEALTSLEPRRKRGMPSLFALEIERALEDARKVLLAAANTSEATKAEVRQAVEAAAEAAVKAEPTRLLFDAAVALRTGILSEGVGLSASDQQQRASSPDVRAVIDALKPAHMPFLFPEVFLRENGGFDVLIGNPPWEELLVKELMWWGLRYPGLRGLPTEEREREVEKLKVARPDLVADLQREKDTVSRYREIVGKGPYPGLRKGHLDLYQAFAWRNWQLLRESGSAGLVLPRGALSTKATVEWRNAVLSEGAFSDVCILTNAGGWVFDGVDGRYTVSLVAFGKTDHHRVSFCGPFYGYDEFKLHRGRQTVVSANEFMGWSSSSSFPALPDVAAGEILRKMKRKPSFDSVDGFEFRPVQGDLNATTGKPFMDFNLDTPKGNIPVLAGASFNLWDPDFGRPYAYARSKELVPHLLERAMAGISNKRSAVYGQDIQTPADLPFSRPRIAFRDIARATDSRTSIFCLIPPGVAVQNKAPYLLRRNGDESDEAYLLGILSSLVFDWYSRRWVEISLNFYLLQPMPVPRPDRQNPLRLRVVELAARLAAVDQRYEPWASAVGVELSTLSTDPERSAAIAELDALSALLYELEWSELEHIFETFHRGWSYTERLSAVKKHYDHWKEQA